MKPMTIVHGRDGSAAQLIGGTAEQAAMVFNAQHQHASQYRPVLQVSHSVTPPVRSMSSSTERSAKHDGPKNVMKRNGRKACNCTRSACLKLYCDCFANGEFCDGCNCKDCYNNLDHDFERSKAIKQCLERNPNAFQPKIAPTSRGRAEGERVHLKGCHCKRSNCLKNYCECYEARVACSNRCKCVGCCNVDSNRFDGGGGQPGSSFVGLNAARSQFSQRSGAHFPNSGLMSLAAAAAADMDATSPGGAHDGSQSMMHSAGGSTGQLDPKATPWYYMTDEVVEATALCLMAQAEECERQALQCNAALDEQHMEALMLREFGRCLKQVISNCHGHTNPDEL